MYFGNETTLSMKNGNATVHITANLHTCAMSSYKLTYLNFRGRAELIRFILAQAGVQYEDYRITPEKWPEIRPTTPFGVLPILEFDGHTVSGNASIARYLAEKYGLAGSSDLENMAIFSLVEVMEDLWVRMGNFFWEKNEERKEELKKVFVESYLPLSLKKLEISTAENNAPEGWIYGNKVTYADFAVYILLEVLLTELPTLLDNLPSLAKIKSSVEGLPNIAQWVKDRPQTPY